MIVAESGRCHGAIDNFRLNQGLVALHIHDKTLIRKACGCLGEAVRSTLVVRSGHYHVPAKAPHGVSDPSIVDSHENSLHRTGLLNAAVDVLYQCLALNFEERLAGETGGVKTSGDNRYGACRLHTPHIGGKLSVNYTTAPLEVCEAVVKGIGR